MCDGCKQLADREAELFKRQQDGRGVNGQTVHLRHVKKTKPHCDQPTTCTCQHRPFRDGYVKKEG